MRIVSFIIILGTLLTVSYRTAQKSPHGSGFNVSCSKCHSTKGWQLDKEIYSYDHNSTRFPLQGQHTAINCRECHPTLVFSEARTSCMDCHRDVHQSTVGPDCGRCHTPVSWLVSNIVGLHQVSRFPLLGAHRTADCIQCHKSENPVRFDVPGINCIDCHRNAFISAKNPDHLQAGFSEDCTSCHMISSFQWSGSGFDHSFFPLTLGHSTPKCSDCHTTGNYRDARPDCYSCHQQDYQSAANPSHTALGFQLSCTDCHTTNPGWSPAQFKLHDSQYFPIFSGTHNGKWSRCSECHTITGNYSQFNCIVCHANAHKGKNYTNAQCYECHPKGRSEGDKR